MYKLVFLFFIFLQNIFSLDVPFLSERVIDQTNTLATNTILELTKILKAHEKETSNQIAVLIIPSLEGEILEDYSHKVATTWGLGQKNKNNGVLLLIAKKDRKLRIEVGSGLEGSLTDATSSRIIRNEITPEFKKGNFDQGVKNGIEKIILSIKGEYKADSNEDIELGIKEKFTIGGVILVIITPFTFWAIFGVGLASWFLCFFLTPFYGMFSLVVFGINQTALSFTIGIFVLMILLRILFKHSRFGKNSLKGSFIEKFSSGGSSGGFSGGGGSFSGGGSSGSW